MIIDGTTSWNKSLYQISIYYPGILRKKVLIECKTQGLKNTPPKLNRTRWNSLLNCVNYILRIVDFFKDGITYFSNTVEKCAIELDEAIVNQLSAVSKVLRPIIDSFCWSCLLRKLLNSITYIDDPHEFGF